MESILTKKNKPFHCLYVSALFDIYQQPDKITFYIKHFSEFAEIGVPIVLYCDKTYYDAFKEQKKLGELPSWKNVEIVCMYLEDLKTLPMYELISRTGLSLPNKRTPSKDTQSYMALMNAKLEFMRMARHSYPEAQYLFWLDAAFLKIIQNKNYCKGFLQSLRLTYPDAMLTPGCWSFQTHIPEDSIGWRFAGGAFSIRSRFFPIIYQQILDEVKRMVEEEKKVSWEVNVWAQVERKHPGSFIWYHANHNDEMLHIPRKYIQSCIKISTHRCECLGILLKCYVSARSISENVYFEPCEREPYGRIQYVMDPVHIYKKESGWVDDFYTCRMMVLKEEETDQKNLENEIKGNDLGKNEVLGKHFSRDHMIDWFYDKSLLSNVVFDRIQRVLRTFRFQQHLIQKSKEIADRIQHPALGIYIRTWRAPWEVHLNRPYHRRLYVNAIQEELQKNPDTKTIILTIDYDTPQWDELREIQEKAGLIGRPVVLLPFTMNNMEVIQRELIQLLVLSQCDSTIGARICNLFELMFWFSGCQQRVKTIL